MSVVSTKRATELKLKFQMKNKNKTDNNFVLIKNEEHI